MFERYTEKARRVVYFARYEALQYNSNEILPEYLLLALIRVDSEKDKSKRVFGNLSLQEVRRNFERGIASRKDEKNFEIRLSPATKEIIANACQRADELKDKHIRTEYLLWGILNHQTSVAKELLWQSGFEGSESI